VLIVVRSCLRYANLIITYLFLFQVDFVLSWILVWWFRLSLSDRRELVLSRGDWSCSTKGGLCILESVKSHTPLVDSYLSWKRSPPLEEQLQPLLDNTSSPRSPSPQVLKLIDNRYHHSKIQAWRQERIVEEWERMLVQSVRHITNMQQQDVLHMQQIIGMRSNMQQQMFDICSKVRAYSAELRLEIEQLRLLWVVQSLVSIQLIRSHLTTYVKHLLLHITSHTYHLLHISSHTYIRFQSGNWNLLPTLQWPWGTWLLLPVMFKLSLHQMLPRWPSIRECNRL